MITYFILYRTPAWICFWKAACSLKVDISQRDESVVQALILSQSITH